MARFIYACVASVMAAGMLISNVGCTKCSEERRMPEPQVSEAAASAPIGEQPLPVEDDNGGRTEGQAR